MFNLSVLADDPCPLCGGECFLISSGNAQFQTEQIMFFECRECEKTWKAADFAAGRTAIEPVSGLRISEEILSCLLAQKHKGKPGGGGNGGKFKSKKDKKGGKKFVGNEPFDPGEWDSGETSTTALIRGPRNSAIHVRKLPSVRSAEWIRDAIAEKIWEDIQGGK